MMLYRYIRRLFRSRGHRVPCTCKYGYCWFGEWCCRKCFEPTKSEIVVLGEKNKKSAFRA